MSIHTDLCEFGVPCTIEARSGERDLRRAMNCRTVYVDVENTLNVPFVSGIQRVTRRVLQTLEGHPDCPVSFVPVVHENHRGWRTLTQVEERRLYRNFSPVSTRIPFSIPAQRAQMLKFRLLRSLQSIRARRSLSLGDLEAGSVFLDMESSWHNQYRRSELLPKLKADGISIVAVHYDIIPILMPDRVHPRTQSLFTEHILSQMAFVDLFICISRSSERDLLRYAQRTYPGRSIDTTTITLGSDIAAEDGAAAPGARLPSRYLLSVGTIEPRKNLDLVVDALRGVADRCPGLGLVIAGRYGWNAESTLLKIREALRDGLEVLWLDRVSDRELKHLYENALLTVVPSTYEGCGLPVLEALRYGCPVLSSTAGALPEAGGDLVDYFQPDDAASLTALIIDYIEDPSLYRARKTMVSDFTPPSWKQSTEELVQILARRFGGLEP